MKVSKALSREGFVGAIWKVQNLPGLCMICTRQGGWRFLLWPKHNEKEEACYSKLRGQRFSTRREALQALKAVLILEQESKACRP